MIKGFHVAAKLAKACPFCGGKRIVTIDPDTFREDGLRCVWIECDDCGGRVSGYSDDFGDYNTAYRNGLMKWNGRVSA